MLTYCAVSAPLKRKPEQNPEGRIPEGRMKVEIRRPKNGPIRISVFGFLSGFGPRISAFGVTFAAGFSQKPRCDSPTD
jgi:hypothetical protein